jgi:hypothetical protein
MMAIQQPQQPMDWAHNTYVALNNPNSSDQKWPAFVNGSQASFSIPPSVLSQASIERFGQITPPEEPSPTSSTSSTRGESIPVEQLKNESLWPEQRLGQQQQSPPGDSQPPPKRRRTSRQTAANANQTDSTPAQAQDATANPQPPKRKRGRPKSQPQMVEAYTADGFPFQVSSARQSHLEKNRVAAHKCRQRKKEYIGSLESRAREFSAKNKALKENVAMLREEVLSLKNEVLRHAGCGFWAVDEYLARCAGDLLGMEVPFQRTRSMQDTNRAPSMGSPSDMFAHEDLDETNPSLEAMGSSPDSDDYHAFDLLKDYEMDAPNQQ